MALTVTASTPNYGPNIVDIAITNLAGTGFVSTPTVKITKAGQSDIAATSVVYVSSVKLTCVFPISGAAIGTWTIRVTNPDTTYAELVDGFTVSMCDCKGDNAGNKQPKITRKVKVMIGSVGASVRPNSGQLYPRMA